LQAEVEVITDLMARKNPTVRGKWGSLWALEQESQGAVTAFKQECGRHSRFPPKFYHEIFLRER